MKIVLIHNHTFSLHTGCTQILEYSTAPPGKPEDLKIDIIKDDSEITVGFNISFEPPNDGKLNKCLAILYL